MTWVQSPALPTALPAGTGALRGEIAGEAPCQTGCPETARGTLGAGPESLFPAVNREAETISPPAVTEARPGSPGDASRGEVLRSGEGADPGLSRGLSVEVDDFIEQRVTLVDPEGMKAMGALARAHGYLWVELAAPGPQFRGRLGLFIEENVETELEKLGAMSPGIHASTSLDASLSDQLYRARLLERRGIALGIPSLEGITNLGRTLDADDGSVLRWWIAAAADRPVSVAVSRRNVSLRVHPSPVLFETLFEVAPAPLSPRPPCAQMADSAAAMDLSDLPPPVVCSVDAAGADAAATEMMSETQVLGTAVAPSDATLAFLDSDVDLPDLDRALGLCDALEGPPGVDACGVQGEAEELASDLAPDSTPSGGGVRMRSAWAPEDKEGREGAEAAEAPPGEAPEIQTPVVHLDAMAVARARQEMDTLRPEAMSPESAADTAVDAPVEELPRELESEPSSSLAAGVSHEPLAGASLGDWHATRSELSDGADAEVEAELSGGVDGEVESELPGETEVELAAEASPLAEASPEVPGIDADEFLRVLSEDSARAPLVAPEVAPSDPRGELASDAARDLSPLPTKEIARKPFLRLASPEEELRTEPEHSARSPEPGARAEHRGGASPQSNQEGAVVDGAVVAFAAASAPKPLAEPDDPFNQLAAREWTKWAKNLAVARGPKPLSVVERMFVTDYTRLREAVRRGIADEASAEVLDEWRDSFEKSYTEAFDALRVRGKRPTMVLDLPEMAQRLGRLQGARRVQLVLVDGMRFDLGIMIQDRLRARVDAALTERLLLWSALPTTTSYQLELLGRGADGLKEPCAAEDTPTLVARGKAARSARRIRAGHLEVYKIDVVEDALRQPGLPVQERFGAIADDAAEAIAEHLAKLPPRTLVVVFGDHGFSLDPSRAGTTREVCQGGASPEEVLVPAFAWLTGAVH